MESEGYTGEAAACSPVHPTQPGLDSPTSLTVRNDVEDCVQRSPAALAALSFGLIASLPANAQTVSTGGPDTVMAIDIALEPDATMIERAEAANKRLLQDFPKGFALDESHHPHISCLQRYVRTADLNEVNEAVAKVLVEEKPATWKLKAYKYYFIPWKEIGLAGIVIEPTADLIRFQQKLIDAVAPFSVKTGTAAAFVTTKEDSDINQPTIDYVASFVPDETGNKFNPHVTIGVATQDYLNVTIGVDQDCNVL
jgi:hypothetical protein